MTEVCSLSSGLYEIAKMSGTTKDDSGRTLLRTWRQVKKISNRNLCEICVEELRNRNWRNIKSHHVTEQLRFQ